MRHVRSVLYATVLAPVIWVLAGMGFGHRGSTGGVVTGMGLLVALLAGFVYAILLFAPISPAGPLTGGGLLLIASLWALTSPASYAGLWPAGAIGSDLARPGYGPAALLAVPLIATALSARRWETYEPPELPLIGRLDRSHGVAKPTPGPPAAVLGTAVQKSEPAVRKTVVDPDSTVAVLDTTKREATHESDATIAIPQNRPPVLIPGTGPADDSTIVIPVLRPEVSRVAGPDDDSTIVVPVRPPADRDVAPKELIPEKVEPARADQPTPVSPADVTQVISLDLASETQVIPRELGSDTQVIRRDLGGDTQVIRPPATRQPAADADETQVIRPPAKSGPPADAEETQVINLNARPAAAGPAERPVPRAAMSTAASGRAAAKRGNSRTTRHRAAAAAARERGDVNGPRQRRRAAVAGQRGEARAARQRSEAAGAGQRGEAAVAGQRGEAAGAGQRGEAAAATRPTPTPTPTPEPSSIADAERPDPAADPTIRLGQVPGSPADPDTVEGRVESASHAERPADESADDTRRLTLPTIPGPRRRPDDETD